MKRISCILLACLLLAGCTSENQTNKEPNSINNETTISTTNNEINSVEETTEEESTEEETIEEEVVEEEPIEEVIDLTETYRNHKVNESGKVLVIMYHNLSSKPGSYASTPELFRAELERLYEEGYRTVSMTDLVTNNINIPIGTTPVVLTFDDGTKSNFYYDENGEIAKDCVVGILDEFYAEHPDFGRNAIFYLYGRNPFRQTDLIEKKLRYLIDNGYEIGNHTFGHDELNNLDAEGIQRVLATNQAFLESFVPEIKINHLSLPYGKRPNEELEKFLWSGTYGDTTYEILSAVNVGWNPIASPGHSKFNSHSINRVTCGEGEARLSFWLDQLKKRPEQRYYSDGNPDTIVVPEQLKEDIAEEYQDRVITYKESEGE